uniref:hypothetical protein n=1 Tax=Aquisalimonas sp. TaxID=1872621 RepID=UPI0025C66012
MARRIAIPGLINLLRVDDAREIRALDAESRVDRSLEPRGGLINRLRLRRIAQAFVVDGHLLPAFLRRDAPNRERERASLEARLNERVAAGTWSDDPAFATLVAGARGEVDEQALGVAAQGLLGRLFKPGYEADPASYEAACVLDRYPRVNALRALGWAWSGRLRHARQLLRERADGDGHAVHATAIALHNLVRTVQAMAALRADPSRRGRTRPAAMLAQCLAAPDTVLRLAREPLSTPAAPRRLQGGELILFRVQDCVRASGDTRLAF